MSNYGFITLSAKVHQALGQQANDKLIAATTPTSLANPTDSSSLELYSSQRLQEFEAAEGELAVAMQRLEA